MSEQEIMRGNLTKQSKFRLFVEGPFNAKEISNLIVLLEAQKEILIESEEASAEYKGPMPPT